MSDAKRKDSFEEGFRFGIGWAIAGLSFSIPIGIFIFLHTITELVNHDPSNSDWKLGLFLIPAFLHLIYIIPISLRLRRERRLQALKGFLASSGVVFLLCSTCGGLFAP